MATSIQVVGGRPHSFNDLDLLVLLHMMICVAEISSGDEATQRKLINYLTSICESYGPGTIDLHLDALSSNQSLKSAFLHTLSATESQIDSIGEVYPAQSLKGNWRTPGVKISDYKSDLIRSAAKNLRMLLQQ